MADPKTTVGRPLLRQDRPWSEYPVGTIAESIIGGYWTKTDRGGWKWCVGDTFPQPGVDAYAIRLPRGWSAKESVQMQPKPEPRACNVKEIGMSAKTADPRIASLPEWLRLQGGGPPRRWTLRCAMMCAAALEIERLRTDPEKVQNV